MNSCNMNEVDSLQTEDIGESSNFVRQGSLRKVISADHKNDNLFGRPKDELHKLYKDIHLEYLILAEYKSIISENIQSVYVIPSRENFLEWFGVIFVKNGPYQDGIFRFELILDPGYPKNNVTPLVRFQSKMFHPAINPETNELNVRKAFPIWDKSENHIWQVVKFVVWVFKSIEGSLGYEANKEASQLFRENIEEFKDRAKRIVANSLEHLYDEPPTEDKHYITFEPYNSNVHEFARSQLRTQLLTQTHDDFFKFQNSWVLPGSLIPLGRPPTPDSDAS